MRLVPSLSAPSPIKSSASFIEEMPPAALIFTPGFTFSANNATSSLVAPPVENPVLVLIYSAPDAAQRALAVAGAGISAGTAAVAAAALSITGCHSEFLLSLGNHCIL